MPWGALCIVPRFSIFSSSDSGRYELLCGRLLTLLGGAGSVVALQDERLKESQCAPRLKVGADAEFDVCFYSCSASA